MQVLIDVGFEAVEIPTNSPDWEQSITKAVAAFGDRALIGAGTVLTVVQVEKLQATCATLMVTPNINAEVIRRAVGFGLQV